MTFASGFADEMNFKRSKPEPPGITMSMITRSDWEARNAEIPDGTSSASACTSTPKAPSDSRIRCRMNAESSTIKALSAAISPKPHPEILGQPPFRQQQAHDTAVVGRKLRCRLRRRDFQIDPLSEPWIKMNSMLQRDAALQDQRPQRGGEFVAGAHHRRFARRRLALGLRQQDRIGRADRHGLQPIFRLDPLERWRSRRHTSRFRGAASNDHYRCEAGEAHR